MQDSLSKPLTRLLNRQLKKTIGLDNISDPKVIELIELINNSYIFHKEENGLYRKAEEISNRDHIKMNDKLSEKNSFLDTFNHGMAHDIKNHTSNIIGLVQMLKKYTLRQNWEMIEEITTRLDSSANHLTSIVQGFLYLSRAEVDAEAEVIEVDKDHLIKSIEHEISFLKQSKNVTLTYCVSNIFYTNHIVKIILVNLISNAIKYAKENEEAIVKVSLSCDRSNIELIVEDNGIGMDLTKENRKLFNLFNDSNTTKGYGVGLFLVKKIVDRNKGEIFVESKLGEGTKMRIVLPKNN